MPNDPSVKTADAILGPMLDQFYVRRPNSFQHLNYRTGTYWHPFQGFRAQATQVLSELITHVKNGRLTTAEGPALREFVASEFTAVPFTEPSFAVGEATFTRSTTTTSGDIPTGSRLTRKANLTTQIPLQAAQYETLAPVHFDVGQSSAGPVPIRASSTGSRYNHPIRTDAVPHGVSLGRAFDPTIVVDTFDAAGGSDGVSDPYVRQFARAHSRGQFGPIDPATYYGALSAEGVQRILVHDVPGQGIQKVLVADASWASSTRWAKTVQQYIYDNNLVGVGCRVVADIVRNVVISVEPTIRVRDAQFLSDTLEIDTAVNDAIREYFDDRPDWNTWRTSSLRGAITRAHPRILSCPAVTVRGVDGSVLSEQATPNYLQEQFHYDLANNAVTITYQGPS